MSSMAYQDKVGAAHHEAAHIVVAAVLDGVYCGGHIFHRSNGGNESLKEWGGQVRQFVGRFSPAASVAGIVAECLAHEPDVETDQIIDYLESECVIPSKTDLRDIPESREERWSAVEQALKTLRENEPLFRQVVTAFLDDESGAVTDGMVKEWCDALR
jgi:hypothetical protein